MHSELQDSITRSKNLIDDLLVILQLLLLGPGLTQLLSHLVPLVGPDLIFASLLVQISADHLDSNAKIFLTALLAHAFQVTLLLVKLLLHV